MPLYLQRHWQASRGADALILDTHILLWALAEPKRIPKKKTRTQLESSEDDVLSSAAGLWEIAIKVRPVDLRSPCPWMNSPKPRKA